MNLHLSAHLPHKGKFLVFKEQDRGAARFRAAHIWALPSTWRDEPNFGSARRPDDTQCRAFLVTPATLA
jgi:hypothetical protein